jgi:YggT family protein
VLLTSIIFGALNKLIWIIIALIFVRCVFSFFPSAYSSRVGSLLVTLTEPVLWPIRKLFMKFKFARSSPYDFTPMVAVLLLYLIQNLILMIYYSLL